MYVLFQLIVRARDQGNPERIRSIRVFINVIRDITPAYDQSFYAGTIIETLSVGESVIQTTARDPNGPLVSKQGPHGHSVTRDIKR